jgi:hypothetical protein
LVIEDFVTFEDKDGPEMIQILSQKMTSYIDKRVIIFKGFSYDTITVKNESLHLLPHVKMIERAEKKSKFITPRWLHQIYSNNESKDIKFIKEMSYYLTSILDHGFAMTSEFRLNHPDKILISS